MLQFHFDVGDRFLDRKDYQLCEMDTDSLYMALSTPSFEEAIKPEMRKEFYRVYPSWFPAAACDEHQDEFVFTKLNKDPWIPPPCCTKRATFDKRTPGLCKVEFQGDGIIALCSKTYFCFGEESAKLSCKEINKQLNDLTKASYLNVFLSKVSGGGINRNCRTDGCSMYTYQQQKRLLVLLLHQEASASRWSQHKTPCHLKKEIHFFTPL